LLSLLVASAATLINAILGMPLAFLLARRRFRGRAIIEALVILPLVLPPTVVGYILMLAVGRNGLYWLLTGRTLLFTIPAEILASSVVAFPLLVMPMKSAFASIERDFFEEARLAGITAWQAFCYIALPMARRGVVAGLLLAFARAMGEFGATLMLVSTGPRTRTLPIQIYVDAGQTYDLLAAWPAMLALAVTSTVVIVLANRLHWLEADR
jgi:molybdate transport system permease protein